MAKSDSRLPNLPSINDLLEHPSVKTVVESLNQSTVAQRATGFLQELRTSLLDRHEKGLIPNAEQLAERFARHLLGVKSHRRQIINATGVVGGMSSLLPPLAEPALHQVLHQASEYHETDRSLYSRTTELLCELTGSEAAWISSSFAEAVMHCSRLDTKVSITPNAGIIDPEELSLESVPTIPERLKESEIIAVDGAGLLGGPACGIVVGSAAGLKRLSMFTGEASNQLDTMRLTALMATLDLYQSDVNVVHQIPVLQLLSTPLENLKQRCERLATLLEHSSTIAEAAAQEIESTWWKTSDREWRGKSWAIVVRAREGSAVELAEKLKAQSPSLIVSVENESLLLDLRSVFPRWDQQLVQAFDV